jgi:Ca2+-transporting ATPase
MFGGRVLTLVTLQGLMLLAAVLVVYLGAVFSHRPDDVVRSITFATLVVGNLALILVNRSWRLSAWRALRERRNPTLAWIIGGACALMVALLSIPWLREAFHFGPMRTVDWFVALAAGMLGVSWVEVYKWRRRGA